MAETALQKAYAEAVALLLRWVATQEQGGDEVAMCAEAREWLAVEVAWQSHWPPPYAKCEWSTRDEVTYG